MSTTAITMYCPNCKENVLTTREDVNLFLAFILVIFTSGIGLLIYLIIYYEREPNHCVHCHVICEPLLSQNLEIHSENHSTDNDVAEVQYATVIVKEQEGDSNFCYNCGTKLQRKEAQYCPLCGTSIE